MVTAEQMRLLDRIAMRRTGPTLLQMMENAGRNAATLLPRLLPLPPGEPVLVLAGTGGNGGGAICAARHLANHGYHVDLALSGDRLAAATSLQLQIYRYAGGSEVGCEALLRMQPGVILDGLIGYSLHGAPKGTVKEMIEYANASRAPVLALDVPSGVDATTGEAPGVAVTPTWTMTLALPKTGLCSNNSGEIYLADIGIPRAAFEIAGIPYEQLFADGYVVPLDV